MNKPSKTITTDTFARLAARLDTITTTVVSPCADPDNPCDIDTEQDYDAVSLSLARMMATCAWSLLDAGYATEGAVSEAAKIVADLEKLQARRGAGQ